MLFGRRKEGFAELKKVTQYSHEYNEDRKRAEEEEAEEKPDLLDYLDSLEDVGEPSDSLEEIEAEEVIERTEAQLLADFIRERSMGAHLTSKTSLEEDEEDIEALLRELEQDETCKDITTIEGDKDIYYYSTQFMSDNYAMIAVLVDEKDVAKTIAQMVRWNSETYPCPTPIYYFNNSPYNLTDPQIERALHKIKISEEYSDVCELTTGNDKRYLYSTKTMSEKYARALAESVEQGEYGY